MSRNTTSYDSANAKDTDTYHIICTLVCTRAVNNEPEKTITCQIRYTCCRVCAVGSFGGSAVRVYQS